MILLLLPSSSLHVGSNLHCFTTASKNSSSQIEFRFDSRFMKNKYSPFLLSCKGKVLVLLAATGLLLSGINGVTQVGVRSLMEDGTRKCVPLVAVELGKKSRRTNPEPEPEPNTTNGTKTEPNSGLFLTPNPLPLTYSPNTPSPNLVREATTRYIDFVDRYQHFDILCKKRVKCSTQRLPRYSTGYRRLRCVGPGP